VAVECAAAPWLGSSSDLLIQQLLREWPPGFGGVERVAHALAAHLGSPVVCLRGSDRDGCDPLPVGYRRRPLPTVRLGRFLLTWPSPGLVQLLRGQDALLVHLPCPTVLALAGLARLMRPRRVIWLYWHAFLDPRPGLAGWLEAAYQWLALGMARHFPVVTTSPPLAQALVRRGCRRDRVAVLPCALPRETEELANAVWSQRQSHLVASGRLMGIGRLDSYKRWDWLIQAFADCDPAHQLDLVGDGPDRQTLQAMAARVSPHSKQVCFHGRLTEAAKGELLSQADLLVLPSDRCNEAFGLVQLEAMACGIPSVAFDWPLSGMHWVSQLAAMPWSGQPQDLVSVLQQLLANPELYRQACLQARQRYEEHFCQAVWQRSPLLSAWADSAQADSARADG